MKFTHDWFTPNIEFLNRNLSRYSDVTCAMIEIGCYEGLSTVWFVENILTHKDSRIVCIDTFEGSVEHGELGLDFSEVKDRFIENTKNYRDKVRLLEGESSEYLKGFTHFNVDVVYIDGSHMSRDVIFDACLSWDILKHDGTIVFDDYGWDRFEDKSMNPRMAIDAFLDCYANEIKSVEKGYQVAVVKK